MTSTATSAGVRINRWNKILDDDYYVANGLSSLLLGAKYYTEANEKYACIPDQAQAAVAEFVPLTADIKWSSRLKSAEKYFEHHGLFPSTNVGSRVDHMVARWLSDQKKELRAGTLSEERVSLLDHHIPAWRKSKSEISWDKSFQDTKAYFDKYGILPSRKAKGDADAVKLGGWLGTQKGYLKNGLLPDNYIEKLDAGLPTWRFDQNRKWYVFLQRTKDFVEANGRLPRETAEETEEKSCGLWIKRQRLQPQRGLLSEEQILALNAIDPNWEVTIDARWIHILQEVCDHFTVHGSLPKDRHKGKYGSLGIWVRTQKDLRRLGKITDERQALLDEKIPLWRESVEDKWERDMRSVAAYFAEHRAYPPINSADPVIGFLGEWICGARRKLKDGLMSDERKAKLDDILPHWDDLWHTNIMLVTEYVDQHGKMPRLKSEDKREEVLGRWVSRQKKPSNLAKLSPDYRVVLESALVAWEELICNHTFDER